MQGLHVMHCVHTITCTCITNIFKIRDLKNLDPSKIYFPFAFTDSYVSKPYGYCQKYPTSLLS